jgi:hypothetical protein
VPFLVSMILMPSTTRRSRGSGHFAIGKSSFVPGLKMLVGSNVAQ